MIESGLKVTNEAIFEYAIEIEYKAADIYREFSQLFSHIHEIYAFWRELTEEEMQHADMLQDIRKSLTNEQLQSPCDKKLLDIVARIQHMLRGFFTESIKNLDDAYELAHELEFSEINVLFKLLATKFVSSEQQKKIVSKIMLHQQKLMHFNQNFGDRDWRKGISIHAV